MDTTPKTTPFYDPVTGAAATIIKGLPSSGKTGLLLGYARDAVSGRPVLIVSNEVPENQIRKRLGETRGAAITVVVDTTIDEIISRLPAMAKEKTGFRGLLLVNGIDYFVTMPHPLRDAVLRLVNEAARYEVELVMTMQERRAERQPFNAPIEGVPVDLGES